MSIRWFAYRMATAYECYLLPTIEVRRRAYRHLEGEAYVTLIWLWWRAGVSFVTRPRCGGGNT